jgi:hypothetical protein
MDIEPNWNSAAGLTARDRALLRAVATGRCDLVGGAASELRVDGRWYCDQARAHVLVAAGLLTALRSSGKERGPAQLTTAGRRALAC